MSSGKAIACRWLLFLILLCRGITSHGQLAANFSATPTAGCAPLVVFFTDQSTGNPTSWKWDLGNGTISLLQNPSVTYFTPGTYNIKLVVKNAAGTADSIIKNQYITVYAEPVVNFSGTPLIGCYPLPVQFTDLSQAGSGTITSWEWDFGDGNISSSQNPSHIYTGAGNYNVSLRVKNNFGCIKTVTKPSYIQISSGVHADFTNSISTSCNPPINVNFTNTSTGTGALTYQWLFGDGGTSVLMNPSHIYNAAGSYTVKLIVTNSAGCTDTITKVNLINLGTINTSFTKPDSICTGNALNITNTSTPAPVSVLWNFGDGTTSTAINPVKVYNTTGVFVIKLVCNYGTCMDSVSKQVTVLPGPTAAFTGSPLASCNAPLTVNFTSTSVGVLSYQWDFGDGNTSSAANPSHTYNATGIYNVRLTVTNSTGCSDTMLKTAYVKIQPPTVDIPNLPAKGCAPYQYTFSADTSSIDGITGYLWDFGDGTTSTLPNPTHIFPAGTYTITLIVTTAGGCKDTVVKTDGIVASSKPHANFTANPRNACAFTAINFTDLSTGGADQWLWNFGDGTTSSDHNPIHDYSDTGFFSVTLIVWNNGCPDTIRFIDYIHINPPIAVYSADYDCNFKRNRIFHDASIGADTWDWDFGDGNTSTLRNPIHTYADTGWYTVTLKVKNLTTGCEHSRPLMVHIVDEKADFTASDTVICKGSVVTFQKINIIATNVVAYNWNFGDGTTGVGPSVAHTYLLTGTYSVTLVITDIFGCFDTLRKPLYIRVDGPTSRFTASVPGACLNSTVAFNDNSISDGLHPIQQWIWNYGDGTSDTLTSPPFQHTYTTAGNFTVWLKLIDSKGCVDSSAVSSPIVISKPVASFIADTLSCTGGTVVFTDQSTGPNLTYLWNFGDGNTSSATNPTHQYATQGVFTVSLKIVDQYGCTDSITRNSYVTIINPQARFSMSDSLSTCPPLVVTFTNNSTSYTSHSWNFGDGTTSSLVNPTHFYSTSGVFNVVLTVTGVGGCTNQITKQVIVRGPQGTFTYSPITGCSPLTVNFVGSTPDSVSFVWDFNDGTTIPTTGPTISHTYTTPGFYLPKMILIDPNGCQVPIVGTDTIKVFGVNASFTSNTTTMCDSGFISFTTNCISNDIITGYLWNFGDGTTSTLQNPVHPFNASGSYNITLTVTTQLGCTGTASMSAPITIVKSPKINIGGSTGACTPATLGFLGQTVSGDTTGMTWNWNLGNGNTSILQNPPVQVYPVAGSYTIKLVAMNAGGCKDSTTKVVQAYPLPTIVADADTIICKGQSFNLTANGGVSYTWSPSTWLSCTSCANPVARPDTGMKYIVQGSDANGCINRDTVSLSVKLPFAMNVGVGDTLCIGGKANLSAVGAFSYVWSPSTGLNNPLIAQPVASPSVTTTYMVVGTDNKGCFKDTGYVPVIVFPIPKVDAGADKTIYIGQSVDLMPILSSDVTNATWTPTSGVFRNNYPGITVKPLRTTEYTISVSNAGGCKASDKATVYVICNNANVFIPNTFSPNGDGANDVFYPRGNGLFMVKMLRIYNRWGEVVFERSNMNPNDASVGWDGTYKGQKLPPDVFVYTIDIQCENEAILNFKGNIALIQ